MPSLVSDASYYEKKLLNDLFKDYKKNMRPVIHDTETINVTIGLSLNQIIDVVSVPSVRQYIHSPIQPSVDHPSLRPSIHHLFIHPSINAFIHYLIHPSIY